jgi:cation-transporting ATPase 13A3/4/5
VWHISAAWFCLIMFTRHRIQNYFRIETFPHTSPFVQVERKEEQLVFLQDGNRWLAKMKSIESKIIKKLGYYFFFVEKRNEH